jgi:tetratricopeptide (TPR) repeat protein
MFLALSCGTLFASDSALVIIERAHNLSDAGEWNKSRELLTSELAKAKKKSDKVSEARLLAGLAIYNADRNSYYKADRAAVESALKAAREAAENAQDKTALAIVEQAEGRITYWQALTKGGSWEAPTQHFDRALQLTKELGDNRSHGWALFYRGLIYQMQEQNKSARETFDRALQLAQETGDGRLESFVVRHIGYLQQLAQDISNARGNYTKSLELRKRNNMKVFVPFAMIALADFEAEQGNKQQAFMQLERAVQYAKTNNSPHAAFVGQLSLAKAYREQGRIAEAKSLAEQSRAGAESFGSAEDVKEASGFLSQIGTQK